MRKRVVALGRRLAEILATGGYSLIGAKTRTPHVKVEGNGRPLLARTADGQVETPNRAYNKRTASHTHTAVRCPCGRLYLPHLGETPCHRIVSAS